MSAKGQAIDFLTLRKNVIAKGLCTACGTCVGVCPRGILDIGWVDGDAEPYLAKPPCPECGICVEVCPGNDIPLLQLEEMALGRKRVPDRDKVGVYKEAFSVHAVDINVRENGAAGGAATALLAYALDKGVIDAALVAGFNEEKPYRPEGKIVTESEELTKHARSKYGGTPPVNALLSKAILERRFSKLGIIGCPCHVHGIRKIQLSQKPKRIAHSIKLVLGLFCGTQFYFEATRHILGELCGVDSLDEIVMIDYRWGDWPGRFYVKTKTGREVLVDRHEYVYHNFIPYWQRDRCTMCIDHTAELADIAIGDFWVPGAKAGDPGWSLVIARNELGMQLLKHAEEEGYIIKHAFDMSGQAPSGAEFKKHRAPFVLQRRKRYGIPVPDYGFTLGHEPGERRTIHRAPSFSELVVESGKKR